MRRTRRPSDRREGRGRQRLGRSAAERAERLLTDRAPLVAGERHEQVDVLGPRARGEASDGVGTQVRRLGRVGRDLGEQGQGAGIAPHGERAYDLARERRVAEREEFPHAVRRESRVSCRKQPHDESLDSRGRRGIRQPSAEHLDVGHTRAGLAPQRVRRGESSLERAIVEIGAGEHGLHLRCELPEVAVGDPAQALEEQVAVGPTDHRPHPAAVVEARLAQGDECPDFFLRRQCCERRRSRRRSLATEGRQCRVGEHGIVGADEREQVRAWGRSGCDVLLAKLCGTARHRCCRGPRRGEPRRRPFVDREPPDPAAAVDRVRTEDPVGEVEGAVGAAGHARRTEVVAAGDELVPHRVVAGAAPRHREVVHAMLAPRRHDEPAAERQNRAGTLADAVDHAERPT